jgi:hypothetical protein
MNLFSIVRTFREVDKVKILLIDKVFVKTNEPSVGF